LSAPFRDSQTILFGTHARSVIAAHPAETPLFLYLPSQDTHGPSDVPINYLAPYEDTIQDPVRRQLAAKLSVLDELIKNVTEALAAKGMLKDTLIMYAPHSYKLNAHSLSRRTACSDIRIV
jgi:arylsulfatase B